MKRVLGTGLLLGAIVLGACADDGDSGDSTNPTTTATATTAATQEATAAATEAGGTATAAPSGSTGLDPEFGDGGIIATPLSATENDRFLASAIDGDGNIFAVGWVTVSGDNQMALAKFSPDGTPDASFGTNGVATVNVASGGGTAELGRALAIQSDGSIVIGGPVEHDTTATGDAARDTDFAVVRFDSSGQLDAGFGVEGIAQIDVGAGRATSETAFVGDTSWGLGSVAGDAIVVFGSTLSQAGGDRTDSDFFLAGLTAAGELDTAFGNEGLVILDSPGQDNPRHVTVLDDGNVIATGYSNRDGVVMPVLIRLSPTGELDSAFGEGGVAIAEVLPGVAESYAAVAQGDSYISAGYGRGADETEKVDLIVDRFDASGAWDTSFGTDGVVRLDLAGEDDRARNVTVLPDNRILAVGSGKMDADNVDAMVYLMDENGGAIADFGTDGHILTDLGGPADAWFGVSVTPDGEYAIVVGYKGVAADSGDHDDSVIARIKLTS